MQLSCKGLLIISIILCLNMLARSQDFMGFRTANYAGVNSVFFNPANIADSRYRFDLNLFSISTAAGNNQTSFNLNEIMNSNDTKFQDKFFGASNRASSALLQIDIHGPSLRFNAGKKRL